VPPFLEQLRVTGGGGDLLDRVAGRLNELDRVELQGRFEAAGASFWSRVGD
jgi:hypothetical protein